MSKMSNILRETNQTSDVYNFADETKADKTLHKKQRKRTTSLTSKSTSTKAKCNAISGKDDNNLKPQRDAKWRCDAFREILSTAVWINDSPPQDRQSIEDVLEALLKHIRDKCECVADAAARLLMGNTYYELFLFKLKNFENRVIRNEEKDATYESVPDSKCCKNKNTPINDIPVSKNSKFDSNEMSDLVNLKHLLELTEPLNSAINEWSEALAIGRHTNAINDNLLIKLKVYYNISAVYQVFGLYNMYENQLKAAILLDKFCRYNSTKQSEIGLTAIYYVMKSYIELGAIGKAVSCHRNYVNSLTINSLTIKKDKPMPDTYGTSLMLLAECELDLLTGNQERAARMLKAFLQSEYLQKLTINRYFTKGLALLIASKLNGTQFEFSNCFQEFIEPIQMSVCILKRWYPYLCSQIKPNNENMAEKMVINVGDLDPIWYRYAVINFAFNAIQLSTNFNINVGMPVDAIFYYNSLIKLARRHCAVIWLSKLLIIGSHFDVLCDYKSHAIKKLRNASLALSLSTNRYKSVSVFSSSSSPSTISPNTKADTEGRYRLNRRNPKSETEMEPIVPFNAMDNSDHNSDHNCDLSPPHVCQHENLNLFDIKRALMKSQNDGNNSESGDYVFDGINTKSSMNYEDNCEFLELLLIKLEIDLNVVLLTSDDCGYILRQLNDTYVNSIENYTSNILKSRIEKLLKNQLKTSYKMTFNELENHGISKSLKFKIYKNVATFQVQNKQFKDAINTCNEITRFTPFSYEERMIKSELLYCEAFCKFELWKLKYKDFIDHIWVEYNNDIHENESNSTFDSVHTPSPPQNKNKSIIPNAPKHKHGFKSDELQDYMVGLKNAVYKETMEAKANSSTTKTLQSKSNDPNQLHFESDPISRSLSISETNTKTTDEAIPNIDIDMFLKQNSSLNRPLTRSRSSSLKQLIEVSNTSISSYDKPSKPSMYESIIELSDSDEDNSIEILDEVFQELNINEDYKVCQKFSDDSKYDLNSIIDILRNVSQLMASHPIAKVYVSVHKLLTEIYSLSDKSDKDMIAYYFSETSSSVSFRYRNLFIAEKKRKYNRKYRYDVINMAFNVMNDSKNSINEMTNNLPNDWRVIQISVAENESKIPDLLVCRYQNGKTPVFLRIKSDPKKIIKHFMEQFNELIKRSNASIINKDRETFWKLRYALDSELMILLRSVEETWFGPFRGILFGQLLNKDYQIMCHNLKAKFLEYAKKDDLICVNEGLLEVVIESLPSLKYLEFKTAMKILFKCASNLFISKCFTKFEQLLIEVYPIQDKESIFTTFDMSAVGFILDKSLESFPFESLPSLRLYNESIFRTPSVRILSLMFDAFKDDMYLNGINERSVFYVLNPADNLSKTEEYFKESFLSIDDWKGVIGKAPEPEVLKNAFESKEVYIFFGHGAGASYYRAIPEGLDGCNINSASIIIGCSSGKLFSEGKQLESYGTPYRFIMNGSPSYVGVLWDVTDKDIDKFSDHLLTYSFSNWKSEPDQQKLLVPISKAVSMSRDVCKLKHLIGSAPVVYGLPLFTRTNTVDKT